MKFRKKPVVIEAWRIPSHDEEPSEELLALVQGEMWEANDTGIIIPTLEGDMLGNPGDWIIRGVAGEFYPCKPDIFAMTYEEVTE